MRHGGIKVAGRVTKRTFEEFVSREINALFASLDYAEASPGAFCRRRGAVIHGFGLTPNPSYTHFHVPVGVQVLAISRRLDYVDGANYPAHLVSRWLGEFKSTYTSADTHFHFANLDQLHIVLQRVRSEFEIQAEPWLKQLGTIEEVAQEFFRRRVQNPLNDGGARAPDPFAWAIYGWLLEALGQEREAKQWFERAREELSIVWYMKNGRRVDPSTKGAQRMPQPIEESRLLELIDGRVTINS